MAGGLFAGCSSDDDGVTPPDEKDGVLVKVMSYNIYSGQKAYSGKKGMEAIAQVIKKINPDLAGLPIVVRSTKMGTLPSNTYIFCCASTTILRAVQILPKLTTMHPTRKKLQMMPTNFILFSKFLITIFRSFWGYIIFCIAPVAVILACWATPSPKFRVEKAVSPSGIIQAARSGTRFKHFKATMLAAMR